LIPIIGIVSIFIFFTTAMRNAGNGVSDCSIHAHRPPLGACAFSARSVPCGAKTNFMSSAFTTMSNTLQSY